MTSHPFSYLQLANVEEIEALYAQYLDDPSSVDESWRYFFEGASFGGSAPSKGESLKSYLIIQAYRREGHLIAKVNPFAHQLPRPKALQFDLSDRELDESVFTYGVLSAEKAPLKEVIRRLEEIYCGSMGIQYDHCTDEVANWIKEHVEKEQTALSVELKRRIFSNLNKADRMEHFLHTKYVGQKRFSLEGGETVIPMLCEVIELGGILGVDEVVIGMPHRGRVNVLANVLQKSYAMIFSEFEDVYDPDGGDGDVKYHKGYSSTFVTAEGHQMHVSLTANPSHLESVAPVTQGRVYAKQVAKDDHYKVRTLPIILHGDASLPGQGVVYETMQMGQLKGYGTGGTLHLVVDNQVGFTTVASEYRSTHYSTDIAKTFGAPVFHVNGEDPEACIRACHWALELRQKYHIDVFLNLICYRKYGHNETDEPSFTQPQLYAEIKGRPSIREKYRDHLIEQGTLESEMAQQVEEEFRKTLDTALSSLKESKTPYKISSFKGKWEHYRKASKEEIFEPVQTAVDEKVLKEIGRLFSTIPTGFKIHPKLKKLVEDRAKRIEGEIDWGLAEHLAFGSLLVEGHDVRLSGQDCGRGTFTHRHAVWVDQVSNEHYIPLCHLAKDQGHFMVYNSPLSEFGVLGFEFGYSLASPASLVLWEAQFGDFANGAQVLIDQYLVASEQKWQRYSGLVLLLPHGYEGQGAEHSSARLERYLQLCAQNNIQVCYPTTPAQFFHLIRRQMIRDIRLPLVVMTPKGLLRHRQCVSTLSDLSKGRFQELLFDKGKSAKTVICCSGRVYYDLVEEREKRKIKDVAIIRFEQLYPLKQETLQEAVAHYEGVKRILWVQEEPGNMGAGRMMVPLLQAVWDQEIHFISRMPSAAAATASHHMHEKEYQALMDRVFNDGH